MRTARTTTNLPFLILVAGQLTSRFAAGAKPSQATYPEINVNGSRPLDDAGQAGLGGSISIPADVLKFQKFGEALTDIGVVSWDSSASKGLATTVQSRGLTANPQSTANLSAGRILLNGHPDEVRRFVRDPVTIDRINYFGITDAMVAVPAPRLAQCLSRTQFRAVNRTSSMDWQPHRTDRP
jgi:hypothetical protein